MHFNVASAILRNHCLSDDDMMVSTSVLKPRVPWVVLPTPEPPHALIEHRGLPLILSHILVDKVEAKCPPNEEENDCGCKRGGWIQVRRLKWFFARELWLFWIVGEARCSLLQREVVYSPPQEEGLRERIGGLVCVGLCMLVGKSFLFDEGGDWRGFCRSLQRKPKPTKKMSPKLTNKGA